MLKLLSCALINKEILAYCLNDDRLHEAAHSSAIYGLGSDYSNYSVVSEDKRVKINDDSSYIISNITATTMTSNSTGVSQKSEEFSDKSYDSVPFVDTLFDVAENPVLEITLNDKVVRNFIPCRALRQVENVEGTICNEGTLGMYDIVEGKFYTNKGSGEFLPGCEI